MSHIISLTSAVDSRRTSLLPDTDTAGQQVHQLVQQTFLMSSTVVEERCCPAGSSCPTELCVRRLLASRRKMGGRRAAARSNLGSVSKSYLHIFAHFRILLVYTCGGLCPKESILSLICLLQVIQMIKIIKMIQVILMIQMIQEQAGRGWNRLEWV